MNKSSLGLLLCLCMACSTYNRQQQPTYELAIENVQLFDSKNKTVLSNKTILINADTIAAIVDAKVAFTALKTIPGNNRLLIPGMIDTHIHLAQNYTNNPDVPPLTIEAEDEKTVRDLMAYHYLDHGVTTVIDMGQPETWMDVSLKWQKNPSPNYPNLFICGGSIVSDEDRWQPLHHIEVMNPEDGRKKVRDYAARGLKHMKLYRKLRKPDMEAMADEAKKQGITINTHVDNNVVTIAEAMDFGISNFEHFFTLTPSILSYDEHWKAMNEEYGIKMSPSIDEFAAHMAFFFSYIKDHPEFDTKLNALFDRMAAEGATLSTAFNVLASAAGKTDFFTSFEYFPIRREPMVSYTQKQQQQLETAFDAMMQYAKKAHDKGVKLRIGTDCRFGGRAMLAELLLFAEAGFPIADILQIATLNGYESMKLDAAHGSIEIGKKADMVLFENNPFDDPSNFLSDKTIIKDGQLFSIKKSLVYGLQQLMIDEGAATGLAWLDKTKSDKSYGQLDAYELKNVISEFLGDGRIDEAKAVLKVHSAAFPQQKMKMDGNLLTNGTYALLRKREYQKAIDYYNFSRASFPEAEKTLPLAVLITLLEDGIPSGQQRFKTLKDNKQYVFNEDEMNGVGYLLMQLDKIKEAIAIFELNVQSFPNSWNAYDSLGEAYMADGNKELAIKNYEKSIELNPENKNGIELVEKMKRE